MRTYVAKRLLLILPTLFGVAALVFFIMRVIPGDVTLLILGGASFLHWLPPVIYAPFWQAPHVFDAIFDRFLTGVQ